MLGMFSNSRRGSSSGLANGFSLLRGLLIEFLLGSEGAVIKSGSFV
jgi:hypothetical protein